MRPRTRFRLNHRTPVLTAGRQEGTTLTTGGAGRRARAVAPDVPRSNRHISAIMSEVVRYSPRLRFT